MEFIDRQRRFAELLALGAEHDIAFLFDRFGLSSLVPERYRSADRDEEMTQPRRIRTLLEALGPTFVKLGQIMSTRPDLVPREYLDELKKLQDHVTTVPWPAMRAIAEAELGRPPEEVFAELDPEAMAAASIGQVYRVVLQDGTEAVLKIQRPDIERTIRTDLSIVRWLAGLVQATGLAAPLEPTAIVREFERSLLREIDYVVEGHETDAFRAQHEGDADIVVPRIHWDTTSKRLLTMELIRGIKVSDVEALRSSGQDLPRIARVLVHTILAQVFTLDHFHADPHPGNLLVLEDGRLGLIDFGMSGGFDRTMRTALGALMRDISERDAQRVTDHLLQYDFIDYDADLRALRKAAQAMFRQVDSGAPMHELMEAFARFVVEHKLSFPPDIFFLDKVFGTLEGAVRTLDPQLSMQQLSTDFLPKLEAAAVQSPREMIQQLLSRLMTVEDAALQLPVVLNRVAQRVDAGHLRVVTQVEPTPAGQRAASRRLAAGGVMALGLLWTGAGLAGVGPLAASAALGLGLGCFALGALPLLWAGK